MNRTEIIKEAVKNAKPVTFIELSRALNLDQRTVKRWIEENCPKINMKKRRRYFSPKEASQIITEWEADQEDFKENKQS